MANPAALSLKQRSAFSIIEILIVLALFAVAAGLVVVNFDSLISSYTHQSAEGVFWNAFRKAREEAVARQKPILFKYDEAKRAFRLEDLQNELIAEFALDAKEAPLKVSIFPRLPSNSIQEAKQPRPGEDALPFILCTAQGYSPPTMVTFEQDKILTHITLDPFSAGPL
jgi:prepilin-type N-terminal cleavage/methylation domain-containing protein